MNPAVDTSVEMKMFLFFFLALGLASSDKLDRTYLPPPGSKFAGGSPGAIQVPLEFPKESYPTTTIRPASQDRQTTPGDTTPTIGIDRGVDVPIIRTGNLPSTPETKTPFTYFQSNVPTTTTSYAFTQTTTFPPIEGFETTPGNLGPIKSLFPTQGPLSDLHKQVGIVGFPQFPGQGQIYNQNLPEVQPSDIAQGEILTEGQRPSLVPISKIEVQPPGSVPGLTYPGKQSVFEQIRPEYQQIGEQRITPTPVSTYQRPSLVSSTPDGQKYGQNILGVHPSDVAQDTIQTEGQRPSFIPTSGTEVQRPGSIPSLSISGNQDVFEQSRPEYQHIGAQRVTPTSGSTYQSPGFTSTTSGGQIYGQNIPGVQPSSVAQDNIRTEGQRPSFIPTSGNEVKHLGSIPSLSIPGKQVVFEKSRPEYQQIGEQRVTPTPGSTYQSPGFVSSTPDGQTAVDQRRLTYSQPDIKTQGLSSAQRPGFSSYTTNSQPAIDQSSDRNPGFESNIYSQDISHYQSGQQPTSSPTPQRPGASPPTLSGDTLFGFPSNAQSNVPSQDLSQYQQTKNQYPSVISGGETPIQRPGFVSKIPISEGQSVIDVSHPGFEKLNEGVDQYKQTQLQDLKRPPQTTEILSQTQEIQRPLQGVVQPVLFQTTKTPQLDISTPYSGGLKDDQRGSPGSRVPLTQYQGTQQSRQDYSGKKAPQDFISTFKPGSSQYGGDLDNVQRMPNLNIPSVGRIPGQPLMQNITPGSRFPTHSFEQGQFQGEKIPSQEYPTSPFGIKVPGTSIFPEGDKQNNYRPGSTAIPTMLLSFANASAYASTTPGTFSSTTASAFASSFPTLSSLDQNIQTYNVRPERPQAEDDRNAIILNYENNLTPEGFSYSFDTSNGIHADESGTAIDGVKAQGSYSYIGDDGKNYSVIYSADENGFQPRGDHLPTPPPVPEEILRVIEQAAKDEEAGISDDGSYDENKYGYKQYQGVMDNYEPTSKHGLITNGANNTQNHENRFDEISRKPSRHRGSARRPTTTADVSVGHEEGIFEKKGYREEKIRDGGRPSSRVPTGQPSVQISSKYAQDNITPDRKIISQNRNRVPAGSKTDSGVRSNEPQVNEEEVGREDDVENEIRKQSRRPSSRFPITRPSDRVSNQEFVKDNNLSQDRKSTSQSIHHMPAGPRTESRIKSEDFTSSDEDLRRQHPISSGIREKSNLFTSKYPKSDYESKSKVFDTEVREEVQDTTLQPSAPSQSPDRRLGAKYPGDIDGMSKQNHEIGQSLDRNGSSQKPSRLPSEKQTVKYIEEGKDKISKSEKYDNVLDDEYNIGTNPSATMRIPNRKPEIKEFTDSYIDYNSMAGKEFNRRTHPMTSTRLPEKRPGSKFEADSNAVVDKPFDNARKFEFNGGRLLKPSKLPSRKPGTKHTDNPDDYDNIPEEETKSDKRPVEPEKNPNIRPGAKYTVTKDNVSDKFIERSGISKMQEKVNDPTKGPLRTTGALKGYSEISNEEPQNSEKIVSKVETSKNFDGSHSEIPSIRSGFGQKLGRPTEINHRVGFEQNKYLTQTPSKEETGYQYIPPQQKFDHVENKFPSRAKPKNEEVSFTGTSSKSKTSFEDDNTARPFMTPNVSREDDDLYEDEEDHHFPIAKKPGQNKTTSKAQPHIPNESDLGEETEPEYYQEGADQENDHEIPIPSRFHPGESDSRNESTRRPSYDDIRQSTTRPKYTPTTQDFQQETLSPGHKNRFPIGESSKTLGYNFETSTPSMSPETRFGSTQLSDVSYPGIQRFTTLTHEESSILPADYSDSTTVSGFETSDKLPNVARIPSVRPGLGSEEHIPSTTYRPNYTLHDKTISSEDKPTVTVNEFGRLIPSSQQISIASSKPYSPGFIDETNVQNTGFLSTGEGQNLQPGVGLVETPDNIKEKPGEFGSTVESFGKQGFSTVQGQAVTTPSYPRQPSTIGEDFSGPKQPQRYDPETGYHY